MSAKTRIVDADRGLRFLEVEETFKMFPEQRFNIEIKGKWREASLNRLLNAIQNASMKERVVLASQKKVNLKLFRERNLRTSASKLELAYAIVVATVGFEPPIPHIK